MLRRLLDNFSTLLAGWLYQPGKVVVVCVVLMFFSLVADGTLLRLWSLDRNQTELEKKARKLSVMTRQMNRKIKMTNKPEFMERQALERFELATEGDLIFVFNE